MKNILMYAAISICFILPASLFAQKPDYLEELKTDLTKASSVTNDDKRLQQYDKIVAKYGLSKKGTSTASKWTESVDINPLDDERRVILSIVSADLDMGLSIRRSMGQSDLYITCGKYLGLEETVVTYRVGKSEAQNDTWSISSDKKGAFFKGDVNSIIQQMAEADQFVVQVIPYSENAVTGVFDIRGLKPLLIKYKDDFVYTPEEQEQPETETE